MFRTFIAFPQLIDDNHFSSLTTTITIQRHSAITPPCRNRKVLVVEMLEERTNPTMSSQPILIGGSPDGTVQVDNDIQSSGIYALQETLTPFGNISADVRTAVGDVNGDGIPDYIFATGPGTPFMVR